MIYWNDYENKKKWFDFIKSGFCGFIKIKSSSFWGVGPRTNHVSTSSHTEDYPQHVRTIH